MNWNRRLLSLAAVIGTVASGNLASADEGAVPRGVHHLDHVFVILMENHSYDQILGNPSSPFMNASTRDASSLATNYYAVAHPESDELSPEIVGGSNFGVLNDNSPDWHNVTCTSNLASATTSFDNGGPNICPIQGAGTDAATPILDTSNETSPPAITAVTEIDGKMAIPAATNTSGITIADQLVESGKSWKSYQESLSPSGANLVDISDGYYDDTTDPATLLTLTGATPAQIVHLYAVKHNPFAYFQSVQEGAPGSGIGLDRIVGFEGIHGLYDDLESGHLPDFSFVVPNQCNDQHGQNNASAACYEDPNDNGTLVGLNPGLIAQGDLTLRSLVRAIHDSPVWPQGRNAIVIVWDENDYSAAPNPNRVVLTVDTSYGVHGIKSDRFYTHFALLKSLEAGLMLPCLYHPTPATRTST